MHQKRHHHRKILKTALLGEHRRKSAPLEKKPGKLHPLFRSTIQFLIRISFFFLIACFFTLPAIFNLSTRFISDGGDLYLFAMSQVQQHRAEGKYVFSPTTDLRYPLGYEFGIGVDAVGGVLLGSYLLEIFSPVTSYNLTLLILLSLNLGTSFALFHSISKSRLLGIIGAICYGVSFYVLARGAGHLNLMFTAGFPLLTWAVYRLVQAKRNGRDIALFYTGMVLASWGSLQYAIMAIIFGGVSLGFGLVFYRSTVTQLIRTSLQLWKAHLVFGAIALGIFIWSFWPTITAMVDGSFIAREKQSTEQFNSNFANVLLPDKSYIPTLFAKLLPFDTKPNIEHALYLGTIELIVFGLYLNNRRPRKEKFFLGGLGIVFLLFVLGTSEFGIPLPYQLLIKFFPFSAIAEPGRYMAVLSLIITVGIVRFLQGFSGRNARIAVSSLVLALIILERLPAGYFQVDAQQGEYVEKIRQQPGLAVMNLPVNFHRQDYSFVPIYTNKAIIDGYIHWSTDTEFSRSFIDHTDAQMNRFICQEGDKIFESLKTVEDVRKFIEAEQQKNMRMLQKLKQNQIQTLVMHKNADFYHPQCSNVRTRLNVLLDQPNTAKDTGKTEQSMHVIRNGQLRGKLFFPQDGIFSLRAISSSVKQANFSGRIGNTNVPFREQLKDSSRGNIVYTMVDGNGKVYDEYVVAVKAGETFDVETDVISQYGDVNVWYDYKVQPDSLVIQPNNQLRRVFSDDVREVFAIE